MIIINHLKRYETPIVSYLLFNSIITISFFIFIPFSFSQVIQDDLNPLISEEEDSIETTTATTTVTDTDTTSIKNEEKVKTNGPKLTKEQLEYQKLFKTISSQKIITPSFLSLEKDLIFILYKNYLYLYTPYRTSKFKIFKDENSILRKIRFFFRMFSAKSYKLSYKKKDTQGSYYFSVTENGFIPYFIFLPTNKIITFKDMRDYILSYKDNWLQYNNKAWLKSTNFKKYISKNEVYISAGSGVNYWKVPDKITLDKNAVKLLEAKFKDVKKHKIKKDK